MKVKFYILLLFLNISWGACTEDFLDNPSEISENMSGTNGVDKKDVILVQMGENGEVKDIAQRLYDNIPVSWEISGKSIVNYDSFKDDPKTQLEKYITDKGLYVTVIVNIDDIISGKYPVDLFRDLKFYKRDFYIIATRGSENLKKTMLSLIGVYMEEGYYAINYDNVQHYRIFPAADPFAKDNMIGKATSSFGLATVTAGVGSKGSSWEPDAAFNRQMADKEALKRIEIYNRLYGYDKGGGSMDYSLETLAYKSKQGIPADIIIDNSWSIDAYNFQIYSKNNNCILSVSNNAGNGFTANIKDYTSPKTVNVYAYIWNLMQESSSEVTIHSDGSIFREVSYQPQTVNHGSGYSEKSFWKVSVSVSPTKVPRTPWEAFKADFSKESSTDITYKTLTMSVSCKGESGSGLYNKRWTFIPGQFYDRNEAFAYETSSNLRVIDAVQAMTPNYVTWGGWTLRERYQDHINNSMKLFKQQCIYTLESDAQPGLVTVSIKDAVKLQKTQVHYNCGIRYGHQSTTTGMDASKMVWIDFGQWDN